MKILENECLFNHYNLKTYQERLVKYIILYLANLRKIRDYTNGVDRGFTLKINKGSLIIDFLIRIVVIKV